MISEMKLQNSSEGVSAIYEKSVYRYNGERMSKLRFGMAHLV